MTYYLILTASQKQTTPHKIRLLWYNGYEPLNKWFYSFATNIKIDPTLSYFWITGKILGLLNKKHIDKEVPWRRKWQPTLVFLPWKSHGQRGLVAYNSWGHKGVWHDLATKQQQQSICYKSMRESIMWLKNIRLGVRRQYLAWFRHY